MPPRWHGKLTREASRDVYMPTPHLTQPADIEPICATSAGDAALFQVTFDNPCKGGESDTVSMSVDTKPRHCHKNYVPELSSRWVL
jgi:hypothetical protein